MRFAALLALALASAGAAAFEAGGVALGAPEAEVKKAFPSAHCKPLEWSSGAADRRCDDSRISFGGVRARVTVYLRRDAVQAISLRFDARERDRVVAHAKSRWGAPLAEATETISRRDREARQIYKVRWEKGGERALLSAQLDRKRATLEISRGNFFDEIYRVR